MCLGKFLQKKSLNQVLISIDLARGKHKKGGRTNVSLDKPFWK